MPRWQTGGVYGKTKDKLLADTDFCPMQVTLLIVTVNQTLRVTIVRVKLHWFAAKDHLFANCRSNKCEGKKIKL